MRYPEVIQPNNFNSKLTIIYLRYFGRSNNFDKKIFYAMISISSHSNLHLYLLCSAVHCSEVQGSALHCIALQCSAVQCSAVQCRAGQGSEVQCSAVQCFAVQCSAVQCSAVWGPLLQQSGSILSEGRRRMEKWVEGDISHILGGNVIQIYIK